MHVQHGEEIENAETMLDQILRTASNLSKIGSQLEKMTTEVAHEYLDDVAYPSYQHAWSIYWNILFGQGLQTSKGQEDHRYPSENFDDAP